MSSRRTDLPSRIDIERPVPLRGRDRAGQRRGRRVDALRVLGGRPGGLEQDGRQDGAARRGAPAPDSSSTAWSGRAARSGRPDHPHRHPGDARRRPAGRPAARRRVDARGVQGAPLRRCRGHGARPRSHRQRRAARVLRPAGADPDRGGRDRHPRRRRDRPDPALPQPLPGQCGGAPRDPVLPGCAQGRRGAQDCADAAAHLRGGDPRASRAVARPRPHLAGDRAR